ncbi:hypothetical protein [Thalassobacillus hwangdonensis]|uniref:DUF3221 domain-containing protein n=1 Tax=Thalassobacillus hwangdonensis TaxID=546108 RepID=A0ABW3L0I0_9BACI
MRGMIIFVFVGMVMAGCGASQETEIATEWTDLIIWNDHIYTLDETKVESDVVQSEIGEVTERISSEEELSLAKNGAATQLSIGTTIYSIENMDVDQFIFANDQVYRKRE